MYEDRTYSVWAVLTAAVFILPLGQLSLQEVIKHDASGRSMSAARCCPACGCYGIVSWASDPEHLNCGRCGCTWEW